MNLAGGSTGSSKSRRTFSGSSRDRDRERDRDRDRERDRERDRASSRNSFQPVIVDDNDYPKLEHYRKRTGADVSRKNIDMDIVGGQRASNGNNYILMNVNSPSEDNLTKVPWSVQVTTNPELCINLSPLSNKRCLSNWIILAIVAVAASVGFYFYIIQRKRFRYPYYW